MSKETKEAQGLGMPWEDLYGYAQAVKKGDTIWISGQLGHNQQGELVEGMEAQMRQAYGNIKELLSRYNMNLDNVVEEVIYVADTAAGFDARKNLKNEIYTNPKTVASTMVGVSGLALTGQLVEIKITAVI